MPGKRGLEVLIMQVQLGHPGASSVEHSRVVRSCDNLEAPSGIAL